MRVVQINMWHKGSTGRIMLEIASTARKAGHEVWTFSPYVYQRHSKMESPKIEGHAYFGYCRENMIHYIFDRIASMHGLFSYFGMTQLLKYLDEIHPDIIHLHNLHNYTICLPLLFKYIKKRRIRVVWTLHDCWTMTGRCPHFSMVQCEKWKTGCGHCPQICEYPHAYIDLTSMMWRLKKKWFRAIDDMTIVTPSEWLADIVRDSLLKNYPVKVINNGINLEVFKTMANEFRKRNKCENKKIVLGVAAGWGKGKGLDVFVQLANRLPDDYQIVMVGTNDELDKQLPKRIISIHHTKLQMELVEIYSAADAFVNATREDTFPTVNIEALACGTPVITFQTGGSPEIIDETCGSVVECDDISALVQEIIRVCSDKPYSQEACVKRAQKFDQREKFKEYVKLYEDKVRNK